MFEIMQEQRHFAPIIRQSRQTRSMQYTQDAALLHHFIPQTNNQSSMQTNTTQNNMITPNVNDLIHGITSTPLLSSFSPSPQRTPNPNLPKTAHLTSITITPTSTLPTKSPYLYNTNISTSQLQSPLPNNIQNKIIASSNNDQSARNLSSTPTDQLIYMPNINIACSSLNTLNMNLNNLINANNTTNINNNIAPTSSECRLQFQNSCSVIPRNQHDNISNNVYCQRPQESLISMFTNNNTRDGYSSQTATQMQMQTKLSISPALSTSNGALVSGDNHQTTLNDKIMEPNGNDMLSYMTQEEYMNRVEIYEQIPIPIMEGLLLNKHLLHVLYYEYLIHNFLLSSNKSFNCILLKKMHLKNVYYINLAKYSF